MEEEEVKESYLMKTQSKVIVPQRGNFGSFGGSGVLGAGMSMLGPTASAMSNERRVKQVIKKCKNIRETFKEAIENIADKLFALIRSKIQD